MRVITFCLLLSAGGCHPWFKSDFSLKEKTVKPPALISPDGYPYKAGTPSWVPLIDACMTNGERRDVCIEKLPEQELEKFLKWEQRHRRRDLMGNRHRLSVSAWLHVRIQPV
ncbi:MAG: hypothetical protein HOC70_16420 [Gammaproteobacteria bacterium]|nr:hypothetical protein [Gammaproteobacteria bacterium]